MNPASTADIDLFETPDSIPDHQSITSHLENTEEPADSQSNDLAQPDTPVPTTRELRPRHTVSQTPSTLYYSDGGSQSVTEISDDGSSYSAGLAMLAAHHNVLTEDDMFQFLAHTAIQDLAIPNTHAQAMNCAEAKFWKEAERKELEALKEKHTFGKCKVTPAGRKPVK